MADHDRPARYHAYLLRCWQERSHDPQRPAVWRFSLEDPHTGARSGYATLNNDTFCPITRPCDHKGRKRWITNVR